MKIALLTPSMATGGAIQTPSVRLLAERLAQRVDLHVFCLRYPTGDGIIESGGFTIHPAPEPEQRFIIRASQIAAAIRREHRRAQFDVLHALWLHEPGTVAIGAGMLLGRPVVASIGGAEVVVLPEIAYGGLQTARGRLLAARVLQQAALVTGGSEYVLRKARRIVPHHPRRRFRLLPLPVDVEQFIPQHRDYDPSRPRLLHVASLIPVKDQATLLRAFRQVIDVLPNAQLTIVGEDPVGLRASLEQLRETLALTDAVSFVEPLPHAELATQYGAADLFVLSSRHESQAMVVLEAAAAGLPTVGTAVGVVPDLAPDAAVAVPPANPELLAAAILDVLRDPARLHAMGVAARQRVIGGYAADRIADGFVDVYSDVMRTTRP